MEVQFLGGCREVGKSAIMISSKGGTNALLDYGIELQPEIKYPIFPKRRIDVVIPSHAHLDHSGSVPLLFKNYDPKVFMTDVTFELVDLLMKDFFKIARRNKRLLKFSKKEYKKMKRNLEMINYREPFSVGDIDFELYDAGHIPGSAGILLTTEGKNIFYTGDIKLKDTELLKGCDLPKDKIDLLIIESTYGERNHPSRKSEEREFLSEVDYALNQEEYALVPVFAVGRAQELMLVLKGYERYTILDGMAKEATRIILRYSKYLRRPGDLAKIFNKIKIIENDRDRRNVLKKPHIILATAGMLSGGPIVFYLKKLKDRRESRLLFVGFQVEETPGYHVLQSGIYKSNEVEFDVKCKIRKFDFSAHADRGELFKIIKKLNPEKIVCVHGDDPQKFAEDIKSELGMDAIAPANGEKIML
ncbi:MAG: MBL fold metallo-hydrolase [Candidatus Aenigmarchaeota archaeon]|nr:MBL fold metallo-hydrolase [Candidatus Aenigmarchaeota archaeon]